MNNISKFTFLAATLVLYLIVGCATLPENFEKPESYAYTDTDDTPIGKARRDEINAHPGQSGFLLLGNGLDAFLARTLLAENAERSIDVQYYLYHDDLIGRLFTDLLLKAANRGVRVRVLVDDMDREGRGLGAAVADSHPNMEVRLFNPFSRKTSRITQFVTRAGSVTRRMHNKSFTVDNQVTILGGRNIGDEYFEADPDLSFSDLDVLAIGPVVKEVSASFDKYWNDELAYPAIALRGKAPTPQEIEQKHQQLEAFIAQQTDSAYLQSLRNSDLASKIRQGQVRYHWGEADVIYDQPEKLQHDFDKTQYHLAPKLKPYFEGVTQELIIFTPYFVPGKSGVAVLRRLCERGVRVRILTNSLASNDVAIVHSGYAKYRKDMLRAGVELYEMNKKLTREQRKKKKAEGGPPRPVCTPNPSFLTARMFSSGPLTSIRGQFTIIPRSASWSLQRKSQMNWRRGLTRTLKKRPSGWSWKPTVTGMTRSCGTGLTMENRKFLTLSLTPVSGSDWASAF
jgi:putative cardiolipin synthase